MRGVSCRREKDAIAVRLALGVEYYAEVLGAVMRWIDGWDVLPWRMSCAAPQAADAG
jgi:hypothetical protein